MTDARQQELLNTASRLRGEGKVSEAITAYQALLGAYPALPDSWYNLSWLLRQAGRAQEALAAYDEALKRGVKSPEEVHLNRAAILSDFLARPEHAKAELQKAVALNPSYAAAYLNLGNLHEDLGEREDAKTAYEQAHALNPGSAVILSRLAGLGKAASINDPVIAKLQALIAGGMLLPADLAVARYALGRLYDSCGAYEEAAQSFASANSGARIAAAGKVAPYDLKADLYRADQTGRAFVSLRDAKSGISHPDPQPVFILGMFRSGSTLVEQIIGAHSNVVAGGELGLLQSIYRSLGGTPAKVAAASEADIKTYAEAYLKNLRTLHPGAQIITDKNPENFWQIGLIRRMFPNARIINTIRNPLDNLVSVWGLHLDNLQNYSFTPQDIAGRIHAERRMMIHWNRLYPGTIFPVQYEDVIRQPEQEVRRILDFLGLPFEPACLEFHKASGPVKTASVWQVREPLHDRSIGRWKHYEAYLRSLPSDPALDALLAVEPPAKPA